jgi:hypothetical protein
MPFADATLFTGAQRARRALVGSALMAAAGLAAAQAAAPSGPPPYFLVDIPQGWLTRVQGERVTFYSQQAAMTVMPRSGESAQAELQALMRQITGAWRNVQPGQAGQTKIGQHPVVYQDFSGVDPQGVASQARVSIVQPGQRLVGLVATMAADSQQTSLPALTQLHNSMRFNSQWVAGGTPGLGGNGEPGRNGPAPGGPGLTGGMNGQGAPTARPAPGGAAGQIGGQTAGQSAAPAGNPGSVSLRTLPHRAGSGMALAAQGQGERSAQRVAQQTLAALAPRMDRPPRALAGMVSKEDNEAMFSFIGHQRGQLVQGYGLVKVSQAGYAVAVAMDAPERLAQTGAALWAAADPTGSGPAGGAGGAGGAGNGAVAPSPYRNLQWAEQSFGSGRLNLPVGWRILGANQGAVDIIGSNLEVLGLGFGTTVYTPQLAQHLTSTGVRPEGMLVAAAGQDALATYQTLQPQHERMKLAHGGPVVKLTRVREATPVQLNGFNAALIASDGVGSADNRPFRRLALVGAGTVLTDGRWAYFVSEVYAPSEIYAHALPLMMKIWASWAVDHRVLLDRMTQAAQSMRETGDILKGIHANQEASRERISAGWGHTIRGTVVVANNDTGRQSTEWLYQPGPAANGVGTEHNRHMSEVVQGANQQAGYARWRMVNW